MSGTKYYPSLADIIKTENIPDILDFIKDGIENNLNKVFFKNLEFSKSIEGDAAFYSLDLISKNRLDVELAGTGIFLILNPDADDVTISSFPTTISWEWKILRYKQYFDLDNFTYSVEELFDIFLTILDVSEAELIELALEAFVEIQAPNTTYMEQFIDDVETHFTTTLGTIPVSDEQYELAAEAINEHAGQNTYLTILALYILTAAPADREDSLKQLIAAIVPEDFDSYIKEFIIPKARAKITFSAGLEFPRNLLQPTYDENGDNPFDAGDTGTPFEVIPGDIDDNPKVMLTVDEADIIIDTETGIDYDGDLVLNTNAPAMIGNTGFTVDIDTGKLDLKDSKNIPEADADGRADAFKGVYVQTIIIGLPKSLTPEGGQTSYIEGKDILIGSEGGLSGTLSLEGTLPQPILRAELASLTLALTKFDIKFHQNSVETFDIKADLYIPGVEATAAGTDSLGNTYNIGDDGPIGLDITYTAPDYTVAVVSNPLIDIFGIDLVIHDLTFGFNTTSFNSLVFEGELFIPQLKAKTDGFNAHSTWLTGESAPILLDAAYTNSPDTFTFTATDLPAINILDFELVIASCGFSITNGSFSGLTVDGKLLIPGVKLAGTNDDAEIDLLFTYNQPNYKIEITSVPLIEIFKIGLVIDEFEITFNKTSVTGFDLKGELFIPNLKADGPGSNPIGSFSSGAPAPIYFTTSYAETAGPSPDKTFSLTASNFPQINILGLGIDIQSLGFNIFNGNLSSFAVESFLFIPGVKAVTSGTYGTALTPYAADGLAPIGVTFGYDGTQYEIEFSSVPVIKIFGSELSIIDLKLHFDDGGVNVFNLDADIRIPSFVAPDSLNGTLNSNDTVIVGGSPYPIAVNTNYSGVGADTFTFNAGPFPAFEFFGMEISIAPFSFSIIDGSLDSLTFSAEVDLNMGGTIAVDFSYDSGEYEVKMNGGPITLTLGGVVFTFNNFEIQWNNGGITGSTIGGTMVIDGNTIGFTMGFTPEGWEISATGTLGFTIPNILGVTFYELTIGMRSGNFFVEIGKEANLGTATLGAALENLLTIPFVGKYLPSQLDIGFLSFEAGSGLDLNNAQLKLLWPELEGLEIASTGSGLEATIPVNKTIFKTITINTLTVSMSNQDVNNDGEDETVLKAVMDGTLEIGPILGSVSGIGLEAVISYPSGGGNLGPANIDEFGIAGPDGIGLSIDTSGIKGGGYLEFDKEKGEYAGFLGLTIQDKISLNAIAILNTKFPDGSTGISLLIILTVEFNPGIQLGFGFNLSGLGGLFGLHRTMEIEPLRLGVKDGTIDHILFPDPTTFVENAATHLSNIKAIFPVDRGRFVFGPMAKIAWGTPALITAEVGLLLEVPKPIRLAILGVIKAVLPDEENDLIRLQINFLGLIDFGKKFISFDATIFDSKILTFAISGDMAFRLHYGDTPAFLLSVGGFHPSFVSPIPVPSMDRLTVKIVDKSKIKVVLTAYFAVTSNTVQFGTKINLEAKIGSISAKGYFGLDTLFQFSPFYMIASISAGVAISYKKFDLAAIHLSGELEGPTPWKVKGKATFKIVGIEKSFNMSEQFGEERTVTYESIDVEDLVVKAINDETNWIVTSGKLQDENVVLKAQSNTGNVISASGDLTIIQRVLPLNYTIQKYGNRVPSGAKNFAIASVTFGSGVTAALATLTNVKEDFASAEFKNIDKSQKLSIPSFEKMDGGVKVNPPAGGLDYGGDHTSASDAQREVEYEQTLLDYVPTLDPMVFVLGTAKTSYLLQETWMQREVRGGAAARSSASRTRSKLYGKTDQRVSIVGETFAVVSTDDLSTTYTAQTRLEAEALLEAEISADPTLEGRLQVITNHRV